MYESYKKLVAINFIFHEKIVALRQFASSVARVGPPSPANRRPRPFSCCAADAFRSLFPSGNLLRYNREVLSKGITPGKTAACHEDLTR